MRNKKKTCDLCGLDIEITGFELKTVNGLKQFCCEGCKGIYQMLHEAEIVPEDSGQNTEKK